LIDGLSSIDERCHYLQTSTRKQTEKYGTQRNTGLDCYYRCTEDVDRNPKSCDEGTGKLKDWCKTVAKNQAAKLLCGFVGDEMNIGL